MDSTIMDFRPYVRPYGNLTRIQIIERIDAIERVLPMRVPEEMLPFMAGLRLEMLSLKFDLATGRWTPEPA